MKPRIGNTLGLGLAALGRPGYINVGRALDLGGADERTVDFMRQVRTVDFMRHRQPATSSRVF
eukprot:SAG31_NODE_17038_length_685_cov_2.692833_1_plen_63_part_00